MSRGPGKHHVIRRAPLIACALLAAGCTSSGIGTEASLSQAMATSAAPVAGASTNLDQCPNVDLRQGAGTYAINSSPRESSVMQLRYQVAVAQTARECTSVAGNLAIKVGMQGRVVLGPAGGPGVIDVPIRYALVEEGPQPKTLWTKMHRVPVTIGEGQPNVQFTHIEESISVPMPPNAAFDNYVIYIGFDPLGASQDQKKQPAKKRPAPPT